MKRGRVVEETKDIIQQRREKLDEIRKFGVEPYPHKYEPTHTTSHIHRDFADIEETPDENSEDPNRRSDHDETRPWKKQFCPSARW